MLNYVTAIDHTESMFSKNSMTAQIEKGDLTALLLKPAW